MKRLAFGVAIILTLPCLLRAQSTDQAYTLFEQGRYPEAAEMYSQIISTAGPSADLYYNLGTCYLSADQVASARLALERALLLKPGSTSIRNQLLKANKTIEPTIEPLPNFFVIELLISIRNQFNAQIWGWLFLFIAGGFAITGIMVSGAVRKRVLALFGGLAIIIGSFYAARSHFESLPRYILTESHPLYIAPEATSQQLILLGAGTKAQTIDSLSEWYKIILDNNDIGWLPKNTVSKI